MRLSGSLVHSGLQRTYASIPIFSYDAAVVLRPSTAHVYCAYGMDGSIDDGKNRPWACPHEEVKQESCVPGCGEPPVWCNPRDPFDSWEGYVCGFDWDGDGLRSWRPSDLGKMLHLQESRGSSYTGVGNYKGYNEVVIATDAWLKHLPESIEAIFIIDCEPDVPNLHYVLTDHQGTAANCEEGQDAGRRMHAAYLKTYGVSREKFPLLLLRTDNWASPFAVVTD